MKNKLLQKMVIISLAAMSLISFNSFSNSLQEENINVLFIIDNSGSMANNDPSNLRYSAARLFISMLDEGDSVGAVIFSDQAEVLTDGIEVIQSESNKHSISNKFQPVQNSGYTDVKAAFQLVSELCKNQNSDKTKNIIIFLTDGYPEPLNPYSLYEEDTIRLAKSIGIPILSIGLTSGASSNFLTILATETEGQVLYAKTALNLLDVYLQILSQWKNRTILGEGFDTAPNSQSINIDPGMIPYTEEISFIVSKDSTVDVELIDPNGQLINDDSSIIKYSEQNDPAFAIFTLDRISAGEWTVVLRGNGKAQIRAILTSHLKAELISPQSFAAVAEPLLLSAQIIEQNSNGTNTNVIGDAIFNAVITLPNGEQESVDQFYDDGTHGDLVANDGVHSRLYPNTELSGNYEIKLYGSKDLIPVTSQRQVTLIPFPVMEVIMPISHTYELEDRESIPIEIEIENESGETLDKGMLIANVKNNKGDIQEIILSKNGNRFSGKFIPEMPGSYSMEISVMEGSYKNLSYKRTQTIDFEVYIIPKINIRMEEDENDYERFEKSELEHGVPITIAVSSTANQPYRLELSLEGASDIFLADQTSLTIPPHQTQVFTLNLKSSAEITLGKHEFQLIFSTDKNIKLDGAVLPISLNIYEPTITIQDVAPITCGIPDGCISWQSDFTVSIYSSSKQVETVILEIDNDKNLSLNRKELEIQPGLQSVGLSLSNNVFMSRGDKAYNLTLVPRRKELHLGNYQNGIPLTLNVPSLLSRCKKQIAWTGLGITGLLVILRRIIQSIKSITQKPIVTGTLQFWTGDQSRQSTTIDLTNIKKSMLTIGSNPKADIPISNSNLEESHIELRAKKGRDETQVFLFPIGKVTRGYTIVSGEELLENGATYSVGNTHFRYLSDSGY